MLASKTLGVSARHCARQVPCARPQLRARKAAKVMAFQSVQGSVDIVEAKRQAIRQALSWFRVPPKVYFKGGCLEVALAELGEAGKKRAFIVTDKAMFDLEFTDKITGQLEAMNMHHKIFYHVQPDPSLSVIQAGLREMNVFKPDVIIAMGGGSPMDAAKVMWLMYEKPEVTFDKLITSSNDARIKVHDSVILGAKATCVCIPTTSGTGTEVTPFAVVKDEAGTKHTLVDYSMTPSVAILDPQLTILLPREQTMVGSMTTVTHALESFISVFASDYTRGLSKHALTMTTRYLPRAYRNGAADYHAREKMHNAATVAGMAFANTFLGACHCLASELTSQFGINTGLASGLLIVPVLKYMSKDTKTHEALAELAVHLHLGYATDTDDEKVANLIRWVENMKSSVDCPTSLREVLGDHKEAEFTAKLDLMARGAISNAHYIASPRQAKADELHKILLSAWKGTSRPVVPL